jgi:hypothetical protein
MGGWRRPVRVRWSFLPPLGPRLPLLPVRWSLLPLPEPRSPQPPELQWLRLPEPWGLPRRRMAAPRRRMRIE